MTAEPKLVVGIRAAGSDDRDCALVGFRSEGVTALTTETTPMPSSVRFTCHVFTRREVTSWMVTDLHLDRAPDRQHLSRSVQGSLDACLSLDASLAGRAVPLRLRRHQCTSARGCAHAKAWAKESWSSGQNAGLCFAMSFSFSDQKETSRRHFWNKTYGPYSVLLIFCGRETVTQSRSGWCVFFDQTHSGKPLAAKLEKRCRKKESAVQRLGQLPTELRYGICVIVLKHPM